MQQQLACRGAAFVLLVQHPDQGVQGAAVCAQPITACRGQHREWGTQLRFQLRHQWCAEGQHVAIDVFGKLKAVDGHRRDHLYRRFAHCVAPPFKLDHGLAATHIQQLKQVGMAMRFDLPVVQAAAFGDRFAVQQVGRRPGLAFAIQLEHGDSGEAGSCHCGPVR
ncbi:hypothetical protein D3C77_418630 [compost metagenome]